MAQPMGGAKVSTYCSAECHASADGLYGWGAQHSGVGVENSKHGLQAWTYIQSLVRVDMSKL